tara:strand:- start:302 stop:637 length:336 start_codon:yes stop_codon:yes gene_type:complete
MTKKKYYPNNWKVIRDTPAEVFGTPPLSFEDFMHWKMDGWEIPSSVSCIIREQDTETGKVTEHVYSRVGNAKRKLRAIMKEGKAEVAICEHDQLTHLTPELYEDELNDEDY